ncbi:hypothetical protein G5V59_00120 [Nocardioides sp. W3-2-3]|uniref:hypothetical protein n=1 Tax=Nocardioides convexus TaxID=2712224 RepID=UPI00241830B4|nr:hypothetical protein [Nocardioides convexus]NGZ99379.1 hypothetical protein [Nocardioides convexus]
MSAEPGAARRPWRLRGYRKGDKTDKPSIETTERGDQALDTALARLEADSTIVRTSVKQAW